MIRVDLLIVAAGLAVGAVTGWWFAHETYRVLDSLSVDGSQA